MSLVELQAEVEGYRTQAGELAEEFARTHSEVTSDPSLTIVGKRERLEPLHAQLTEQMSELQAREKVAVKSAKAALERKLYGLSPSASNDPASIVSYRDAVSRARELEDADDARELYDSAVRGGDKTMASAILEKALVRGWSSIKADYLDQNPYAREHLDDLASLAKYASNGLAGAINYMVPGLNLPFSAGFPDTQLHKSTLHQPNVTVRPLHEVMSQRLGYTA